jgi:hypothetical protein
MPLRGRAALRRLHQRGALNIKLYGKESKDKDCDGITADDVLAVESTAAEEHLGEAQVIGGR